MSSPIGMPAQRRHPRRKDDTGIGMVQVVLVMLATAMLSTAVLGAVAGQVLPTAAERARVRSVSAADAGLQAGLAILRAATSTVGGVPLVGDPSRLPCVTADAPLRFAGTADPDSDKASATLYSVAIRYYSDDPTGQPESWRAANVLVCTVGAGPTKPPAYALIQSAAATPADGRLPADWADRSVEAVYTFNRTGAATAGGVVKVGASSVTADLCWASPSATPSAGSIPALQPCDAKDPRQQWTFRDDYSVVLAGTQTPVTGSHDGMCLTGEPRTRGDLSDHGIAGASLTPSSNTAATVDLLGPTGGTARALSGSSARLVTSASTAAPASLTVSAWFHTTSRSGTIIGFAADAGTVGTSADRMLWVDSAGHIVWGVSPSSKHTVTSPGSYADGAWHVTTASVGAGGTQLFVDGGLVASDSWTTAGTSSGYWHVGWGGALVAGWAQAPTNPYWLGSLAHVAVFDRQLSAAEVGLLSQPGTWETRTSTITSLRPHSSWPLGGSWLDMAPFLAPCDGGTHQKWAYNDASRLEVEQLDGTRLSGTCLSAQSITAGAPLTMVAGCSAAQDWTPSSAVGAGAAGDGTAQLVNFGEYGRCLDVTNQDVTWPYLIDYPCRADPTSPVLWNQKFAYDPATGQISTQTPTGSQCLQTPTMAGGYVQVAPCSTADPRQAWTKHGSTGLALTSYAIIDTNGRCLSLGPPGTATGGLFPWSTIVASPCDGTNIQKWNAPPQPSSASVTGYRETTTDGAVRSTP